MDPDKHVTNLDVLRANLSQHSRSRDWVERQVGLQLEFLREHVQCEFRVAEEEAERLVQKWAAAESPFAEALAHLVGPSKPAKRQANGINSAIGADGLKT